MMPCSRVLCDRRWSTEIGHISYDFCCVTSLNICSVDNNLRADNNGEMCNEKDGRAYKHSPVREFVRSYYDFESTVSPHVPSRRAGAH